MGSRASTSLHTDEERNFKCSDISLLQQQETKCVADRCQHQRSWCLFTSRWQTCLLCSKAITKAQKGYIAIEIALLAVAWAMEKFNHFLYASHFILETDQKPHETILSESLNQATPRLQWILIRSFAYHFTVRYIPGVTNQLADCLSCLGGHNNSIKLPKLQVHQITSNLNARSDSLQEIRIAMQEDDQLALLKHTITHGWPNTI